MLKVQEIREIIKLIDQSSISEFTYESDGTTVSMKKSNQNTDSPVQEKVTAPIVEQQAEVPKTTTQTIAVENKPLETEPSVTEPTVDFDYEIVSPMVGTLYSKPSPESDVYVKNGSKVENNSIVCIVEAMKLFNEIEAEVTGEIVEVLIEDGELVEYGQPLFRVKKK